MNIWVAAADNNVEKVNEYLSSKQFTPNSKDSNGYTPIHAAAEYAHLELLKSLILDGGDINIKDNDGDTPLHACESAEAAKWLVSLGADLTIKNNDGLTPLQKAEEDEDFPELIAYLRKESGGEDLGDDEIPENVQMSVKTTRQLPGEDDQELPQIDPEQRAKLAEIIENGTDADFEAFLQNALSSKEETTDPEQSSSKKKTRKEGQE